MQPTDYDRLAEELRRAIALRDSLRPGTPARWRAECDAKTLMKRLVALTPVSHPHLAGTLSRPVLSPAPASNTPSTPSPRPVSPPHVSGAATGASPEPLGS